MLGRVWKAIEDAVDGLKTLCVALLFVALGLADYYDVVNVKPMLDYVFGQDKAAKIMILLPFVFGTLRFISSGAVKWTIKWREQKTVEGDGPDDFKKGQ